MNLEALTVMEAFPALESALATIPANQVLMWAWVGFILLASLLFCIGALWSEPIFYKQIIHLPDKDPSGIPDEFNLDGWNTESVDFGL